jgi:hypothetical protein
MELSSFSQQVVIVPYQRGEEIVELSVDIDAFTPKFFRDAGRRFKERLTKIQSEVAAQPKGEKKAKKKAKKKTKPSPLDAENAFLTFFETEAQSMELNHEVSAELLSSGVLVGWTVTENGVPVQPTKEVLMKISPRVVKEMWERCLDAAKTVKKRAEEVDEETLETTHTGSMALRAVGQTA